jgi:RNA recognition motif-containing protein
MKLYVGNLSFNTSNVDLQEMFAAFGAVQTANIVEDRETGRSRGFGFVEMSSKEEGEGAISSMNGKEIDGRSLTVNEAKPRENRSNGGGGYGGGYGGGGNNRSSFVGGGSYGAPYGGKRR